MGESEAFTTKENTWGESDEVGWPWWETWGEMSLSYK